MRTAIVGMEDNTDFWARQFAGRWYRGPASVENDFRRFAAAYRVPAHARARVRTRASGLLAGGEGRRAPQDAPRAQPVPNQ